VRDLTRQSWSRFNAGSGPEAQELANRVRALAESYAERAERGQARLRAAQAVQDKLERPVAAARQVTLWNHLWHDPDDLVPAAVREAALPDLEMAIRTADEQARAARRQRQLPVRNEVPPVIPVAVPAASSAGRPEPVALETTRGQSPRGSSAPALLREARPAAPTAAPVHEEDDHLVLLELTVQFACAVARTDGSISRKERALIEDHLERRFRYDTALLNRARALFAHYESTAIDLEACLERIGQAFTVAHRQSLFEFATQVAEASGPMNEREVRFLEKVSRQWNLPWVRPEPAQVSPAPPEIVRPVAAAPPSAPAPTREPAALSRAEQLALLEIDTATPLSADLIRRQYHRLMELFNPEKEESKGPEFVALAASKRQAVAAAARALIEPFGEALEKATAPLPTELRHNPDLDDVFGA
jgi:tellurite resistance protein